MKPEEIRERLAEENENALIADGFEEELIGICYRSCQPPVAAFDYEKCIMRLVERDGMTLEEAVEFFEFNVVGSYVGENTPVFVKMFTLPI